MSNDGCRVSDGRTGRLVVEGDVLVIPLGDNSAQVLSLCIDMSTIIAPAGTVVKCLWEIVWKCLEECDGGSLRGRFGSGRTVVELAQLVAAKPPDCISGIVEGDNRNYRKWSVVCRST